MSQKVARPNKIFDVAALEKWCCSNYPNLVDDWEFSDAVDLIDFWDWLAIEHPCALSEFEEDWKRGKFSNA